MAWWGRNSLNAQELSKPNIHSWKTHKPPPSWRLMERHEHANSLYFSARHSIAPEKASKCVTFASQPCRARDHKHPQKPDVSSSWCIFSVSVKWVTGSSSINKLLLSGDIRSSQEFHKVPSWAHFSFLSQWCHTLAWRLLPLLLVALVISICKILCPGVFNNSVSLTAREVNVSVNPDIDLRWHRPSQGPGSWFTTRLHSICLHSSVSQILTFWNSS